MAKFDYSDDSVVVIIGSGAGGGASPGGGNGGGNGGAKCDNVTIIAMEWESATDEDTPGVSTDELGDEVFASTIQASLGSNAGPGDNVEDDDLDEAAIERSIREINEAIRRSANGTRKV